MILKEHVECLIPKVMVIGPCAKLFNRYKFSQNAWLIWTSNVTSYHNHKTYFIDLSNSRSLHDSHAFHSAIMPSHISSHVSRSSLFLPYIFHLLKQSYLTELTVQLGLQGKVIGGVFLIWQEMVIAKSEIDSLSAYR